MKLILLILSLCGIPIIVGLFYKINLLGKQIAAGMKNKILLSMIVFTDEELAPLRKLNNVRCVYYVINCLVIIVEYLLILFLVAT